MPRGTRASGTRQQRVKATECQLLASQGLVGLKEIKNPERYLWLKILKVYKQSHSSLQSGNASEASSGEDIMTSS